MINIGASLKTHRENAKLTQSELAKRTGINQQNISRWEKNTHIPNIMDCITLANFYQISIDLLIGLEDESGRKIYNINNDIHHNRVVNINQK